MGYDAQLYPLQNVIHSGICLMDLSVSINWDNLRDTYLSCHAQYRVQQLLLT